MLRWIAARRVRRLATSRSAWIATRRTGILRTGIRRVLLGTRIDRRLAAAMRWMRRADVLLWSGRVLRATLLRRAALLGAAGLLAARLLAVRGLAVRCLAVRLVAVRRRVGRTGVRGRSRVRRLLPGTLRRYGRSTRTGRQRRRPLLTGSTGTALARNGRPELAVLVEFGLLRADALPRRRRYGRPGRGRGAGTLVVVFAAHAHLPRSGHTKAVSRAVIRRRSHT
ncbi:MAG TPA: hypothetical protein VGF84_06950 [Micromonosporaceae bacterium]